VLETVKVTREFLNGELAKYNTLADFQRGCSGVAPLFNPPNGKTINAWWTSLKNEGVGISVIKKFLGNNWSEDTIRNALNVLKNISEGVVDEAVVRSIEKCFIIPVIRLSTFFV
jgi:hypothetical protein